MTQEQSIATATEEQKPLSALERLEIMERNVEATRQMFQYLANKQQEIEAALGSVAKTLGATVSALSQKGLITDEDIMKKVREIDDRNAKDQVSSMVKTKVLKAAGRIGTMSLVVVGRQLMYQDGKVLSLSDYGIVSMPHSPQESEEFKGAFGKSIGDRYELKAKDGTMICLVKEIYDYQTGSAPQQEEIPASTDATPAPTDVTETAPQATAAATDTTPTT